MSIEFTVYKRDGLESGQKLTIDTPSFDIEPHDHAIYLAVKAEMANSRQGTHSTKTRAEVRGGGRKPWKQKGRGGARAGSRRSPIWVGGGRAFGPKPKYYSMKINKKVKTLARKSALAYKYRDGAITVLEDFNLEEAKAKTVRQFLKAFNIEDKRVTLLASGVTENLYLATRNFYNILLVEAERASTYDMLDCEVLLVDKEGLEKLNNRLLAN
ncbi:MAG TPA: 50S ribosomal protein L4 [Candidatus Marinimicrobia bacterium]|nr:50S ribosomal protein L4 [Candidatus Neomarinimicrobiota bacterium]